MIVWCESEVEGEGVGRLIELPLGEYVTVA